MINEEDFLKSLDEVIEEKDKIIVLYSGLWTFIHNIKFKIKNINEIPTKILDLIQYKIGKKRTLILPSFSGIQFHYQKKVFDIKKTIDKDNGLLPLIALKRNYYRTTNPIHSYLIYGQKEDIKKHRFITSWGKGSILEYFAQNKVRICNLGLPWNAGCAYLHRFEEIYQVPWRFYKTFNGKLKKNNKIVGNCSEKKFCTTLKTPPLIDYKPFIKEIENAKSFKKTSNNFFKLESIKTSCLDKIGKKIFDLDPWIIVKNKRQTRNWIKKSKEQEVNNISK